MNLIPGNLYKTKSQIVFFVKYEGTIPPNPWVTIPKGSIFLLVSTQQIKNRHLIYTILWDSRLLVREIGLVPHSWLEEIKTDE